jgi:hypothetical protein
MLKKIKNYFTISSIVLAVIALCLVVFSQSVNATTLLDTTTIMMI